MVEPNSDSSKFSYENVYNKNYTILNKAISSQTKTVMIDQSDEDNRASKISNSSGKKIDTVTVSEILIEREDTTPFIIKIDIEGYEEDLFKNNVGWIKNFPIIIIEIHDWMMPFEASSNNFFKAIYENILINEKRDFVISGENLIIVKK